MYQLKEVYTCIHVRISWGRLRVVDYIKYACTPGIAIICTLLAQHRHITTINVHVHVI